VAEHTAEEDVCVCPPDYCLDDAADPYACPVCKRLGLSDPCPNDATLVRVTPSDEMPPDHASPEFWRATEALTEVVESTIEEAEEK
jgi:hypothetical protein